MGGSETAMDGCPRTRFRRRALLTAVAAVVLAGGLLSPAAGATSNLGFESGLTGWAVNSGTRASVVQTPVHGGANAVALSRASSTGYATITDSPDMLTQVAAGSVCSVSAWVQGPVGYKATVRVTAVQGTTSGTSVTKTVSFTGAWQQLPVAALTMPSGYSTADMRFIAPSFPVGRVWYVDDVTASCGGAPPAEQPPAEQPPATTPVDRAVAAGIYDGNPIHSYGAYPQDFDRDGLQDVLVNPHNEPGGLRLYRNNGNGTFTHVYAGQFISRSPTGTIRNDRHGCDWGDVNRDGLVDVFCTMGANSGTLTDKANELWLQQPGGGFVNKAAEYGVTDPLGPGRAAEFLDVNKDGFLDLLVTNHFRSDGQPAPNRLYVNRGGTSYRSAPEYGLDVELGGTPGNQGCAHSVDVNRDTWTDLVVCGNRGVRLYRNDQGTGFTDVTATSGIATGQWRAAVVADMNKDGRADLVGINGNATQFRIQLWNGTAFGAPVATRPTTAARHVGVGDVNADGNPDVYVVEGTTAPDVLLLGNGTGTTFTTMSTPQATSGTGQSATPFDHDQNGTTDMIVMHGYDGTGPIQLISFPRP